MNASELDNNSDINNATFIGNQSFERYDSIYTKPKVVYVIYYVILALGIPGNVLSAIVWLRRYVADKNSSAIYLATLSINDLTFLASDCFAQFLRIINYPCSAWFCHCVHLPRESAVILEPLLILTFSVERLIAVIRPMQVCHLLFII